MMKKILSFLILFVCLALPLKAQAFSVDSIKELPILHEGRLKPLETFAEGVLLQFSGRRSFEEHSAINWLMQVLLNPQETRDWKHFRIYHPEIISVLGIEKEEKNKYSYTSIAPAMEKVFNLTQGALEVEETDRSSFDREIIRLYTNVSLYLNLMESFVFAKTHEVFSVPNLNIRKDLGLDANKEVYSFYEIVLSADTLQKIVGEDHFQKPVESWTATQRTAMQLMSQLFQWSNYYQGNTFDVLHDIDDEKNWVSLWHAFGERFQKDVIRQQIALWVILADTYHNSNQEWFDKTVEELKELQRVSANQSDLRAISYLDDEVTYNQVKPFFKAKLLYFFCFLLGILFYLSNRNFFYYFAGLLVCCGVVFHGYGLVMRILILGRPPVSNLYETFIFVAFVGVIFGLFIEWFQRKNLGFLLASIIGFVLLVIAGKYSAEGDTFRVLVAVLNSNFWLTVHVPTITMGYGACCVSGILGHIYVLQVLFRPNNKELHRSTYGYLMGTLGLGLTLTFFGTCLGGIWADDSWGRFWGWDPKENGALMIVLWCAVILHAKMSGFFKPLGVAIASALQLVVVAWAWFGVNLLSVGLHSYGFTNGIAQNLAIYVIFEILFLIIFGSLANKKLQNYSKPS